MKNIDTMKVACTYSKCLLTDDCTTGLDFYCAMLIKEYC